jgi:S-formylglutathione hydrolase FrmB
MLSIALVAWFATAQPLAALAPATQAPAAVPRQDEAPTITDEEVASKAMGREMRYRVLLPAGYEASARRYPVLYLLHGLTGDYTDWETRTHLASHLSEFAVVVVMPDAGNSWYANAVSPVENKYEDYIAKDLIEDVDGKFRTIRTRHARAIAGLSMGGYGALKFALKYPASFAFAASFSGALNAVHDPQFLKGGKTPAAYLEEYSKIVGSSDAARASNSLFALAEKADPARTPFLYIDCGTEDGLLKANREFVALLQQRKIAYEYRELPGAHTWAYWDQQLPEMLNVLAQHVAIEKE